MEQLESLPFFNYVLRLRYVFEEHRLGFALAYFYGFFSCQCKFKGYRTKNCKIKSLHCLDCLIHCTITYKRFFFLYFTSNLIQKRMKERQIEQFIDALNVVLFNS